MLKFMSLLSRHWVGTLCLTAAGLLALPARSAEPSLGAIEAVRIATEAYIYGYPLVTFDTARKQQTNVTAPDAEHAPMGEMIEHAKLPGRGQPLLRCANADTLYTISWLDVAEEPGSSASPTWVIVTT